MDIISTYPSVIYEVTKTNGEEINVDNPPACSEPQENSGNPGTYRQGVHYASWGIHRDICNLSWKNAAAWMA